ncbi:MAG: hypothetical protein RR306_01795 [Clostridia bacterium]
MENQNIIQKKLNKTRLITISALLTAISFLMVYIVPTIDIGVWSLTVGSHVPTFIAMFISPVTAVFTYLGTLLAFIIKTGNIFVWLRAGSHIFFIIAGLLILRKYDMLKATKNKYLKVSLFGLVIALVHGIFEALSVVLGLAVGFVLPSTGGNSTLVYLLLIVCLGTVVHSIIDFALAYAVYIALNKFKIV